MVKKRDILFFNIRKYGYDYGKSVFNENMEDFGLYWESGNDRAKADLAEAAFDAVVLRPCELFINIISYDFLGKKFLKVFEEGFYDGFIDEGDKYFKNKKRF